MKLFGTTESLSVIVMVDENPSFLFFVVVLFTFQKVKIFRTRASEYLVLLIGKLK